MRRVIVDTSQRLQLSGPTALDGLERVAHRLRQRGTSIIDLGRFVPQIAPDAELMDGFHSRLTQASAAQQAPDNSDRSFRTEAARWFRERFGVRLSPIRGLLPIAGVRQAIYELALALINPGDAVGIPDPSYPLYRTATVYVGGHVVPVALTRAGDYLPNLDQLDAAGRRPRILFLNYPHNPTSRPTDRAFFAELVRWARRRNVIVVQDFAYGEIYYDQDPPISLLSVPGARQVAVELHSFSFTYNLPGLKLGFAVGHPDILAALEQVQHQLGSRPGRVALETGIDALAAYPRIARANNEEYGRRRERVARGLDGLGWTYRRPVAGPFVWVPVPRRRDDVRMARRLLSRAGVLVAPGSAFGEGGEGFLRLSVAMDVETTTEAFTRLGRLWPERLEQMRRAWGSSDSRG